MQTRTIRSPSNSSACCFSAAVAMLDACEQMQEADMPSDTRVAAATALQRSEWISLVLVLRALAPVATSTRSPTPGVQQIYEQLEGSVLRAWRLAFSMAEDEDEFVRCAGNCLAVFLGMARGVDAAHGAGMLCFSLCKLPVADADTAQRGHSKS